MPLQKKTKKKTEDEAKTGERLLVTSERIGIGTKVILHSTNIIFGIFQELKISVNWNKSNPLKMDIYWERERKLS